MTGLDLLTAPIRFTCQLRSPYGFKLQTDQYFESDSKYLFFTPAMIIYIFQCAASPALAKTAGDMVNNIVTNWQHSNNTVNNVVEFNNIANNIVAILFTT